MKLLQAELHMSQTLEYLQRRQTIATMAKALLITCCGRGNEHFLTQSVFRTCDIMAPFLDLQRNLIFT